MPEAKPPAPTAVAAVRWELPFLLRLPPHGFPCWEPLYGVAVIVPEPQVGMVQWRRSCDFLPVDAVFAEQAPPQNPRHFPPHNYMQTVVLGDGRELPTLRLDGGPSGGFSEARPYTTAVLFMCLENVTDFNEEKTRRRAEEALNSVVRLHRFLTMSPHDRPLSLELDSYCTIVSVAPVPDGLRGPPEQVLRRINDLHFGSTIGKDRMHHIGLQSWEGIHPGPPLSGDHLHMFYDGVRGPVPDDLAVELFLSALRRLDRQDFALAVVDAQSAFETVVADALRAGLRADGLDDATIDSEMTYQGEYDQLVKRLRKLDSIAGSASPPGQQFKDSAEESAWKANLYRLRNRVAHGGLRTVTFDAAKAAVSAGLVAVDFIQGMHPTFVRQMRWGGTTTSLSHIVKHAGRMARLFER